MNPYLRSIGLPDDSRSAFEALMRDIQETEKEYSPSLLKGRKTVFYHRSFGEGLGILIGGEKDENGIFYREYVLPYLRSKKTSAVLPCYIDEESTGYSFKGSIDDPRVGSNLVFSLINTEEFLSFPGREDTSSVEVCLSALAEEGKIILPIWQDEEKSLLTENTHKLHSNLVRGANRGNRRMEELLVDLDRDIYDTAMDALKDADLYSVVQTSFLPWGVESNTYQIMGVIVSFRTVKNAETGCPVIILDLLVNRIPLSVALPETGLFGVPEAGRRFRGIITLQGILKQKKK